MQRIAFGTPRQPLQLGPELSWRPVRIAMAPEAKDFASATAWSITVPTPRPTPASVSDLFLRVQYQGDAARLFHQGDLIDDNFWNGSPWEIGLHETLAWPPSAQQWTLRILPLPAGAPLYIERRPATPDGTPAMPAVLDSVSLIPEYQLHITIAPKK